MEVCSQDQGFSVFQPRCVTVRRATLDVGEEAELSSVPRVMGFVVAGATTRTQDARRAGGVYVWHVHEPALCGQLMAGDRILQIGDIVTAYATVDDVRRILLQGHQSSIRMMVRCDPAGYAALVTEMREAGQQPEQLLASRLKQAGLPLVQPAESSPVAQSPAGLSRPADDSFTKPAIVVDKVAKPAAPAAARNALKVQPGNAKKEPAAVVARNQPAKQSSLRNMQRIPLGTQNQNQQIGASVAVKPAAVGLLGEESDRPPAL